MSVIKRLRRKAGGGTAHAGGVQIPLDTEKLVAAVSQLQDTVNEVITRFNGHSHAETDAETLTLTTPACIWTGGVVTAGDARTVDVSAGEIRKADGTFVAFALVDELALAANASGNPRVDLVQVHATTGVVTKKDGVASGAPVAPAVDAGNLALATVAIANGAVAPGTITDVRPRFSLTDTLDVTVTGGLPTPLVNGSVQSDTNLFTP